MEQMQILKKREMLLWSNSKSSNYECLIYIFTGKVNNGTPSIYYKYQFQYW